MKKVSLLAVAALAAMTACSDPHGPTTLTPKGKGMVAPQPRFDDIAANSWAIDAVSKEMPLTLGGANGMTQLYVVPENGDGKNGCNLTGQTTLAISISSSNPAVATVSPSSATFTSCSDTKVLTITPLLQGSTIISISQTANTTSGSFNLSPATFTVNVSPPPNTAPSISITGVTGGASYEIGSVPAASCGVTDAEDGPSSFAATLSAVTGPLAAYGVGEQTASCSYTDHGGLTASGSVTYGIVDTTAPVIAFVARTTANPSGWNTTDVTANWTCSDSGSGVEATAVTATVSTEGSNQSATGTCKDHAGNVASDTQTGINIDKTAPTAIASASPDPNANGWYNTNVTVSFTGTDGLSGIASCTSAVVLSSEGTNNSASGTCVDKAGNESAPASVSGIKIDKTKPTASYQISPAANENGWYNSSVTVKFTSTDDAGASCETVELTADLANQSATGTCTDQAGNVSDPVTVSGINIDRTAPTITVLSRTPGNANGWNNQDVVVTWSCKDGLAGAVNAEVEQTVGNEGANQSASGTCYDLAGNTASDTQTGINIDKTAPTAGASASPAANGNGWNNTDVTVSFNGTDGLSGIASCSNAVTLSAEGAGQSAAGTCTDKAGNVSAPESVSGINIDKTAPTATASALPVANGNGWNNTDVTVSFSGNDGLSGIASCSNPVTLSNEGEGQSASGNCTDKAGNASTTATATGINIDKTAPAIAFASRSPAANANGWNNSAVTVNWSCSDSRSGPVAATVAQTVSGEGDNQSVTGTCTDKAGNSASNTQSGISIDMTAPSPTANASPAANANGWNNTDVTVSFSASDALSGLASCTADQVLSSEGASQSVSGTCTDKAGNSATVSKSGINIDKTAPAVSANASPAANANGWNNTNVTVHFGATDGLSGVDTCSADKVLSDEGVNQSATGSCTDKAGNSASATKTDIKIDNTAPTEIAFVGGPSDGGSYYFGSVPAAPTCTANGDIAGLVGCVVTGYSALVGVRTMTATASDYAGNSGTATRSFTVLAWTLNGFYAPVTMTEGFVNTVKAGSTVPLKFEVFSGTTELTSTSVVAGFTANPYACDSGATEDPIDFVTTGGTSLRYDATAGQFIQNWQTPKTAGKCYKVTMTTQDGSTLVAQFKLK